MSGVLCSSPLSLEEEKSNISDLSQTIKTLYSVSFLDPDFYFDKEYRRQIQPSLGKVKRPPLT